MTIGERSVLNGFKTQVNLFFAQSSSPINKYVILPISESNSLRDKVIVIGEIALSIITVCAFSATLHLTLKTVSILGKGLGAIAGVGLLDVFSMLICDIAKRTFFKKERQETQEELLDRKLQGASKPEFCDQFFKLTEQALEDMYLPQVQNKIQQETGCDPFYKGLVPILVRFACLKAELQKKEDAMERFFL